MEIVAHSFAEHDYIGGHPALDFVNTVNARDLATPFDWLDGYARLLEWAALAGVVSSNDAKQLRKLAAASPRRAEEALSKARLLRETLYAIFAELVDEGVVPRERLARFETQWKAAMARATLVAEGAAVSRRHTVAGSGLDVIADTIALGAADLLGAFPHERIRRCRGQRCGWLFNDVSKAGRRIWCDMGTCGNFAKSQRHLARQRRRRSAPGNR